jgi:hypothetical protein
MGQKSCIGFNTSSLDSTIGGVVSNRWPNEIHFNVAKPPRTFRRALRAMFENPGFWLRLASIGAFWLALVFRQGLLSATEFLVAIVGGCLTILFVLGWIKDRGS